MAVSEDRSEEEWTVLLSSKKRLDREKGLAAMKTQLAAQDLREEDKKSIETHILFLVTSMIGPWEDKHGGLMATGLILESGVGSSGFSDQVRSTLPILLEETESRVRIAAGTNEIKWVWFNNIEIQVLSDGVFRSVHDEWKFVSGFSMDPASTKKCV